MPIARFNTTSEDGYINGSLGLPVAVYKTFISIIVDDSSSSSFAEDRGFWFMDTSSLGSTAIIDSATWNVYCFSASEDGISYLEMFVDPTAAAGVTLELGDWSLGENTLIFNNNFMGTGLITVSVPTDKINKTGYTNTKIKAVTGSNSSANWGFESSRNISGRRGYLSITYHYPDKLISVPNTAFINKYSMIGY